MIAGLNPRPPSPTARSAREGHLIPHLGPEARLGGRPEASPQREIRNASFDLLRSGGSWRMLPHDLPPWRMVSQYFRTWHQDGTWQVLPDLLRGAGRGAAGQHRQPSAGIIESQSVQT